ncbi:MAG TPA: hypothetical protein VGB15_10260 [Longimicrobium sp.]|jgi:hypothetical protein
MKPISHALLVAAALAACGPVALAAQRTGERAPTRVPLTVVLVPELTRPGAAYEIQRRTTGSDLDVILLLDTATPEQLSDAVRGVLTARQAGADTATRAGAFRVHPHRSTARSALPWAGRVLTDLHNAHVRVVPGVGRVRAVRIWLPPQRGRHAVARG